MAAVPGRSGRRISAGANPEAIAAWTSRLEPEIRFYKFSQFHFYRQWSDVRRYANEKGVKIVGDIPIFVAHDSVDVWANQSALPAR